MAVLVRSESKTLKMMRIVLLIASFIKVNLAFAPVNHNFAPFSTQGRKMSKRDDDTSRPTFPNPFKEAIDMFSNFDDVIDDFFYKRMGNGEQFYGKRKYKPSGNVEGSYNGMGLTDKLKIDISRERKEQYLEEKRRREEEAQN